MADAALADAARVQRDRRAERYPRLVDDGRLTAEEAAIDYQCWVAIAEWLETGRFMGFHGGADPQGDNAAYISWPQLEAAAGKALDDVAAACTRLEAENPDHPQLAEGRASRARLVCIHRKVLLRRQMIDSINAEFRAPREAAAVGVDGPPQREIAA